MISIRLNNITTHVQNEYEAIQRLSDMFNTGDSVYIYRASNIVNEITSQRFRGSALFNLIGDARRFDFGRDNELFRICSPRSKNKGRLCIINHRDPETHRVSVTPLAATRWGYTSQGYMDLPTPTLNRKASIWLAEKSIYPIGRSLPQYTIVTTYTPKPMEDLLKIFREFIEGKKTPTESQEITYLSTFEDLYPGLVLLDTTCADKPTRGV